MPQADWLAFTKDGKRIVACEKDKMVVFDQEQIFAEYILPGAAKILDLTQKYLLIQDLSANIHLFQTKD